MKALSFIFLIVLISGCDHTLQRGQDKPPSVAAPTSLPDTDTVAHILQPVIDKQEAIKRATTYATAPLPEIQPSTIPPTVFGSELVTQSAARQQLRLIQPQIELPESEKMVWLITVTGQWSNPLGANAIYDRYVFVIDASNGDVIYTYLYDTKTIGGWFSLSG